MNDSNLSKKFLVAQQVIETWKISNDYKYLMYSFLKRMYDEDIDYFFHNMLQPSLGAARLPVRFMHKKEFLSSLSSQLLEFVTNGVAQQWKKSTSITPVDEDVQKHIESGSTHAYFYEISNTNELICVDIGVKIQDKNALSKKFAKIKESLQKNEDTKKYTLSDMIYLISDSIIPSYLKKEPTIEDVTIWAASIGIVGRGMYDADKIIFIPNGMELQEIHKLNAIEKIVGEKYDAIVVSAVKNRQIQKDEIEALFNAFIKEDHSDEDIDMKIMEFYKSQSQSSSYSPEALTLFVKFLFGLKPVEISYFLKNYQLFESLIQI
ncbi:hypothetical protein MLC52_05225 [Sulfurimonas sp. NW15]|uniref:hypothetical protein n=1 Tax=Sulfurimonas sp. NW15 TaxID=2922729 RepID=UPI003DA8A5A3